MFTQNKVEDFEIFRANQYRPWDSPSGKTLQLNREPYLDVVLTDRCNRHCKFCIADLIEKKTDCDVEIFKKQIDYAIENLGVREVLVVGGEPTVAKGLVPILQHLRTHYIGRRLRKICLTTNGDKLHSNGRMTDFAYKLLEFVTHINLSLMSTCAEAQYSIGGNRGKFLNTRVVLPELYQAVKAANGCLRINANIFKGNLDNSQAIFEFYTAVASYCDSVKFSPLLRVDNFSVVNITTEWVKENILPPEEYERLFKAVESCFSDYPIVRNPLTFGFVEYSMLCMNTPLILNYNHRNEMAKRAGAGFVNNVKLLTNGDLSLSWNRDDKDKVIHRVEEACP